MHYNDQISVDVPSSVIPRTVVISNGIPGQTIELVLDYNDDEPSNGHALSVKDVLKSYTFNDEGSITINFNGLWCVDEKHHGMYSILKFEYYQHTFYITINYI